MATLPISDVVNITVQVSPTAAIPSGFNLGLIIGSTAVIAGSAGDRVRLYSDLAGMIADGFLSNSVEYVAASLYFGQSPRPGKVAVGRWISGSETKAAALQACRTANTDWYAFTFCGAAKQDVRDLAVAAEALSPVAVYFYTTADAEVLAGTLGTCQVDTATIAGTVSLAGNATVTVTATGMTNSPKAISVAVALNDDASAVAGKIRTALAADADVSSMLNVSGTGAAVIVTRNIPAANDVSLNVAFTNGTCTGLTPGASSANTTAGVSGSICLYLKSLSYTRCIGQYSATTDAAAAIMGYAMGANNGTAGSAYTLAFKQEVGVSADSLTLTQVANLKAANCNMYINRGSAYNLFEQGVMASGMHFDTRIGLDQLSNAIQIAIMNLLVSVNKIPQTEGGTALLVNAIDRPCLSAVSTGFLAGGVWTGPQILDLENGEAIPTGYVILSSKMSAQSAADRSARKSPPIYVPIKLAGAIESVVLSIMVNE